jgi:3-phosphoglycerate kinase
MEAELNALAKVLDAPQRPVAAIVGISPPVRTRYGMP